MPPQVVIELSGDPRGKGRPRFNRSTGRAYTPTGTRSYEEHLGRAAKTAMRGASPISGPVRMEVVVMLSVPASWKPSERAAALLGLRHPTTSRDVDNFLKIASDALNGIVYRDDGQVVSARITKRYSDKPGMRIQVEAM